LKKDPEQELTDITQSKQKRIEYTVTIGNHLFERIAKHMRLMKYLKNDDSNKQEWVREAIKEKLKAIENQQLGDKFLHLKLDVELWQELEEKVESLKAVRRTVSKKTLIEEAIFDKLDREEQSSRELLKNMLKASSEG
jgi:hypothetical protein